MAHVNNHFTSACGNALEEKRGVSAVVRALLKKRFGYTPVEWCQQEVRSDQIDAVFAKFLLIRSVVAFYSLPGNIECLTYTCTTDSASSEFIFVPAQAYACAIIRQHYKHSLRSAGQ